jgi:hypothetical protein
MLVLLDLNHIEVDFSDSDIINIGLELASSKMNHEALVDLILENMM